MGGSPSHFFIAMNLIYNKIRLEKVQKIFRKLFRRTFPAFQRIWKISFSGAHAIRILLSKWLKTLILRGISSLRRWNPAKPIQTFSGAFWGFSVIFPALLSGTFWHFPANFRRKIDFFAKRVDFKTQLLYTWIKRNAKKMSEGGDFWHPRNRFADRFWIFLIYTDKSVFFYLLL